ncbi:helix-turn-helix transcriptional regulator [Paenibacillus beijingensis]|uniref:HTH cro/C1-type domain-containing protein n=1 Tax=Paenibacillus beijingensis TaxID=1126833 RepID=A0A0D5NKT2_9BACL|nr:helix-turn-helix transcriptional regulator [Paenibacillus beijingensis]AJY75543.1 hypothetical protein VN24_14445 [Paenibacillus beijingensis]
MASSAKHKEMGDFLKTRRLRLSPQDAGLRADSSHRRIPGLRREEVAALSGVSLAWYTYMEQGRPIRVSEQVLESLARTLKLDKDERTYLYQLAGHWLPEDARPVSAAEQQVSPALQLILDGMDHFPAYIVGRRWNVVAWNRMAAEVFGFQPAEDEMELNLVWRMFTRKEYREMFVGWPAIAQSLLAQFRGYYGIYSDDPWYRELVERLTATSEEFAAWWPEHNVNGISEGYKRMIHPVLGHLSFDFNSFIVSEDPYMTMTVFTPRPNK